MTILFDWNKIYRAANGNLFAIITIFDFIVYKRKPRSKKDLRYKYAGIDFSGTSYLLHLDKLLEYKHCYSKKEIVEYIALASYRNYAEYVLTGDASLSLLKSPISTEKLNRNRLLAIKENKIYFLFEEVI